MGICCPKPEKPTELSRYRNYLTSGGLVAGRDAETKNAPIFSYRVKELLPPTFPQYALLGRCIDETPIPELPPTATKKQRMAAMNPPIRKEDIIFLNTNAPFSAFICGSQGSGKSYSLSCMMEGCLLQNKAINNLKLPLTGIVYHWDEYKDGFCEVATLCSQGVKVRVLVSDTDLVVMTKKYKKLATTPDTTIEVHPFYLQFKHLDMDMMTRLMGFNESDGPLPLYMESIQTALRKAAVGANGARIDADGFLKVINDHKKDWSASQAQPLNQRLAILQNLVKQNDSVPDFFAPQPGTLTIIDLTSAFIDKASACSMFESCTTLFLANKPECPKVIALDEAHAYMSGSAASESFTNIILHSIRMQRHAGVRVIISTQEPNLSPKLLDLCSFTLVHRFTSPDWLSVLKSHLSGADASAAGDKDGSKELMKRIVSLHTGESLLFCPQAMLEVVEGEPVPLREGVRKFKTRTRLTADAGTSFMAV